MGFPREEYLDLDHMVYIQDARWRLFKDIDDNGQPTSGPQVLMSLGNHYTVMSSAEFRRMAQRILSQLPQE